MKNQDTKAQPIYLDYNGTTPHDPEVVAAMLPFLESEFGNPSSAHWFGTKPREAVARARQQVADLLGCAPQEVFFTSGGTEANNHAIMGIARSMQDKGRHIITSTFEHPAVLEVCRHLEKEGFETTYVPVDQEGLVDPTDVADAIRPDTTLITIMHANNEVGTIQPISEIASQARPHGIYLHTDAAQSVGKIPVQVDDLGVDLLSVAGHKVYAPKGIGALYVRKGVQPEKFCHGASQEMGWRAGTENVLEIVGLGKACEIASRDLQPNQAHMLAMRDRLHAGLAELGENIRLNGHREKRLPNTLSLAFRDLDAGRVLTEIAPHVAASPGAACHSDSAAVSHVLAAMQVPPDWVRGTIRFSSGKMTTNAQIDQAVEIILKAVQVSYHDKLA